MPSPSSPSLPLSNTSSSSSGSLSTPPNFIQLPPPPCFPSSPYARSPSLPSPDPLASPSIYYSAPSSPYAESPSSSAPSSPLKSPGSPPPLPALHITIPQNPLSHTTSQDSSQDEAFPNADLALDLPLDDEGLSALEKIYLFSRSTNPFHRVFIIHAMPSFLEQVTPLEADEYVLPLLRGLAMDDDETIREALAMELVPIVWWFFTHCQLVPDDVKAHEYGQPSSSTTTTICVQAFTPIFGTLLLSPNPMVGGPARQAVVEILSKMRRADVQEGVRPLSTLPHTMVQPHIETTSELGNEQESLVIGLFGKAERELFGQELIQQIIIGMGRLDSKAEMAQNLYDDDEESDAWNSATAPILEPGAGYPSTLPPDVRIRDASSDTIEGVELVEKTPFLEEPPNPYFPHCLPAPSPPYSTSSDSTPSTGTTSSTAFSSPSSTSENIAVPEDGSTESTVSPPSDHVDRGTLLLDNDYDMEDGTFYDADHYLPNEVYSPMQSQRGSRASSPVPDSVSPDYSAFEYPSDAAVDIDDYGHELDVDAEQAAVGRVSSMSLMAATAASGTLREETTVAFVKEVKRVGSDSVHWVRREASFALGALAKVAPQELVISSLLPLFESLRQDPVWHVRQSALFALPAVLSRLSPRRRRSLALQTILPLSKDRSMHVRSGVLGALGEVIYTFHQDERRAPEELLHLFLGRKEDNHIRDGQLASNLMEEDNLQPLEPLEAFFQDPERPVICSFNFPAVVLTVGRDRWPDLRESYLQIASNPNVRVRRTLAASLGEIANIIGEEHAAVDLMPIWWDAIRSEETDVRIKAVECMGKLMAASGGKRRIDVIRGLLALWEEGHFKSWREREGIAMALNGLAALTESQGASTLQQLLLKALHDGVAAIREAALSSLPGIWATFGSDAKSELHAHIISLAHSSNYRQRMTFISCMQTMLATPVIHAAIMGYNDYWSSLAVLARDGIVGVRIGVARVVGDLLRTGEFSRSSHTFSSSSLLEITDVLQADTCSEVRAYLPQGLTSESAHVDVLGTSATRVHNGKGSIFSKPPPPAPSVVELSSALGGEATSSQSPRWVPPSSQAGLALLGELQHSSVAAMGSSFPVPQPEHAIYAAAS